MICADNNATMTFEMSGLPEYLHGSWANANKIIELSGICQHPSDPTKYCVMSLTQGSVHTVQNFKSGNLNCSNCPRFDSYGICAHTLAVSKWIGVVDGYVAKYTPDVNKFVRSHLPPKAGKKPGEKTRVRNNGKKPRHTAGWRDRVAIADSSNDEYSKYTITMVRDTAATTCYGCGGKVRDKPSQNPPPPPFDIFLKRYECRVFKKRGENNLSISKSKEPVYYHPLQSCLNKKYGEGNADNIVVPDHGHKETLLKEFGLEI